MSSNRRFQDTFDFEPDVLTAHKLRKAIRELEPSPVAPQTNYVIVPPGMTDEELAELFGYIPENASDV